MVRIIIGFLVGVIVSRNAQAYGTPFWGACLLGLILGGVASYFFGKRDKNIAVATAVATAVAAAEAKADARAQAIANSAVQIYMQSGQVPNPREMEIVAAYHDGEIANDDNLAHVAAIEATRQAAHSRA